MLPSRFLFVLLFLVALSFAPLARAGETPVLRELPADQLSAMAPLLLHGDIALIEFKPSGQMRQVTVMTLVHAPPKIVREVLATPEKWAEFIPNVTRTNVARQPDGSIDYEFAMDLKLATVWDSNRMWVRADGTVDIKNNNRKDGGCQRWQFFAVPRGKTPAEGEDTIMVQYGYTDLLHLDSWLMRVVKAEPLLEHGLALAIQLGYVQPMRLRAEKLAGLRGPASAYAGGSTGPGFKFLLDRGRVAVLRSTPTGKLADISLLDNFAAPAVKIEAAIGTPGNYSQFLDGVTKSYVVKRDAGETVYDTEFDVSILSWSTRWAIHRSGSSTDGIGLSGDLRNAHFRWDVTGKGEKEALVVYRANQDLGAASPLILGALFRAMPVFEYGIAVTLGLVHVVGVRARAEGVR